MYINIILYYIALYMEYYNYITSYMEYHNIVYIIIYRIYYYIIHI